MFYYLVKGKAFLVKAYYLNLIYIKVNLGLTTYISKL